MTWTKFDDGARRHPKLAKVGNEAAAFWGWAIQYANEVESDGFLEDAVLHLVPPTPIAPKRAKVLADACCSAAVRPGGAGLLERVDGGYKIHDFHHFQPSARTPEERAELSAKRASAGSKGASSRWQAHGKLAIDLPSPRAGAHRDREEISDPEIQSREIGAEQSAPAETPEQAAASRTVDEHPAESAYDLFHRVWDPAWRARHRRDYPWMLNRREDETAREIAKAAQASGGPRAEEFLRHWVTRYLADSGSAGFDLADRGHPVSMFGSRIVGYGEPPRSRARPAVAPVARLVPPVHAQSDEEHAKAARAALERMTANIGRGGKAAES